MAEDRRRGVLLMHHGTPGAPHEIEAFYTRIRRGRPPTPEQLADLGRRYDAIGGLSPLTARTAAQAAGLQRALGDEWSVVTGAKFASPTIEEAVDALSAAGITDAVGVVLAPHYSSMSIGDYLARAEAAARGRLELAAVKSWHLEPGLIDALADRLTAAIALVADVATPTVLFTAHSLPARILDTDDPYPTQVEETARAVARSATIADSQWQVAWQSAGRTPEPWLGPDLLDAIQALSATETKAVVVCPVGFTSDHLEILYDIDIEAAGVAADCGLALVRTSSLNDDPALCQVLAGVVRDAAG